MIVHANHLSNTCALFLSFSGIAYQSTTPTSPQNYNYEPQPARSAAAPPPPSGGVRNSSTSSSTLNVNTLIYLWAKKKCFYMVNRSSVIFDCNIHSFIFSIRFNLVRVTIDPEPIRGGNKHMTDQQSIVGHHACTHSFTDSTMSSAQDPVPLII